MQRRWVNILSVLMPGRAGVERQNLLIHGLSVNITRPRSGNSQGVVLYLHGGAFCLGSPHTHRSITSHLAHASGLPVWTPDYRLAPEHPYPAALEEARSTYNALLAQGYKASDIVLAGDSAGGALALALAIQLRDQGAPQPAGLALISPVTDPTFSGGSMAALATTDPMIRKGWIEQGVAWYRCPPGTPSHTPLAGSLHGLPPIHIQVGDQEILLSDSVRLAEHAQACGVDCRLEIHRGRWHVFHLQALFLRSSVAALETLAHFARDRAGAAQSQEGMHTGAVAFSGTPPDTL
jgi:cyclohexanone monooxygenase